MGNDLRAAARARVLVADGAMGTMLQAHGLADSDFAGYEGCNEILNVIRPDVIASVHRAYLAAGADCLETNTFGVNLTALAEYGIADRIVELARGGAEIARQVADEISTTSRPRFVLGSMGPGTKLPSLGQVSYSSLRDSYQAQAQAMIAGGVDGFQIETAQDLLQVKAAVIGARRACVALGMDLPIFVQVTIETSGAMLLGSEIGTVIASLSSLPVDALGLNCATGPAEMSEYLRQLARHAPTLLTCMPNAGLPELTADGPRYPMGPDEFAASVAEFAEVFGLNMVGGCCGTTPEHIARLAALIGDRPASTRMPAVEPSVSSLYSDVALRQDTSYLAIGERTNANGSKAFREAMIEGRWDEIISIARNQSRDGAHLLDVCVDYAGRDGMEDIRQVASRLTTAVPLPIMLDSTDPAVIEAGLECLAGRCVVNSVNFEDGSGPESRIAALMPIVKEHGAAVVALTIDEEGQARTAERKVAVASRLIDYLTTKWELGMSSIIVDCLTFPITTGQEETRRDALETIEAIRELRHKYSDVHFTLGVSNVSFGLKPAARAVLNSVFLAECQAVGLDSAIVHTARIIPTARIPQETRTVALDLIYDRRRDGYDPLAAFLELFEDANTAAAQDDLRAQWAALPVSERLRQRIVSGDAADIEADLAEALISKSALDIVNDDLLAGMKTVGDLFGTGQMQLPFVLASAEVMKKAVTYLQPHLESGVADARGTVVLATVVGDVHDIGKNLVDIILSNNGFRVINLGIKQPISAIAEAAITNNADAIGMSGLLVKSTIAMRDNLAELNRRELAHFPVILGGAALTRSYVDDELSKLYQGDVRYASDAFAGLAIMEQIMAKKEVVAPVNGVAAATVTVRQTQLSGNEDLIRSDVTRGEPVPEPPFWGSTIVRGVSLDEVVALLDERSLFAARWGLTSGADGASYDELVETQGRPRLRQLLDQIRTDGLAEFGVIYGYWPCHSEGNVLVIGDPNDLRHEVTRFEFPRQRRSPYLCLADYFRDADEAATLGPDVLALQLVTVGSKMSLATQERFADNHYRDYLELHSVGVQLAEALAEWTHARIRAELRLPLQPSTAVRDSLNPMEPSPPPIGQPFSVPAGAGERYSFGYPSCPDLGDRAKIVRLLQAERIKVVLTEESQLIPEQSTDAIIVHHRQARYFDVR